MNDIIIHLGVNLIALGAFYGATKVELRWIKEILEKHEKKIDKILCQKLKE